MLRFKYLLLFLVFLLPLCVSAQKRHALVIGIGEQQDKEWAKINGDKDVPYVVEMLEAGGYKDIRTLVNRQATKRAIVGAFKSMASRCKSGDIVYIHFSGHGQQVKDVNHDEDDGLDESWIPYDAYRKPCRQDNGQKHLIDDEIYVLLSNIYDKVGSDGKILVVVDACHSGTSTRSDDDDDVPQRGVKDVFDTIMSSFRGLSSCNSCAPQHWITISACKDSENNAEMKQPKIGKLTYALYSIINEKNATSNSAISKALVSFADKNSGSRPQTPVVNDKDCKYNIIDVLR